MKENKQLFLLADHEDCRIIYRALLFDKMLSQRTIQKTINDILKHWEDEDFTAWNIDDVLEELSAVYDFEEIYMADKCLEV